MRPSRRSPRRGRWWCIRTPAGVAAIHAGKTIDYVGAAGIIDFNKWHNSGGGFEIAAYQPNGDLTLVNSITAANLAPLIK